MFTSHTGPPMPAEVLLSLYMCATETSLVTAAFSADLEYSLLLLVSPLPQQAPARFLTIVPWKSRNFSFLRQGFTMFPSKFWVQTILLPQPP